jgi:hypothetical protein
MMDLNRNQFFLAGVLFLLVGIQFRLVDSVVLNPQSAKMFIKQANRPLATASFSIQALLPTDNKPAPARTVRPPEWLGFSLLSVGAVLVLHALAMRKPEAQAG